MNQTNKQRKPWTTPELRRIDAGSADAQSEVPQNADDGGPNSQDKS